MEPAELIRRGQAPRKTLTRHPYAAIEHRVIDSAAYAALTFSARSLLLLIARQLSKDNNGHLQATYSYMQRFGFSSEHTLSRAIKELISHGMIYRTRSGGYQQGAGKYAVTWLSVTRKDGLFLQGFKPCAWRDWVPDEKTPPAKMQDTHCKNGKRTPSATAKNAARHPLKSADIELMPCRGVAAGVDSSIQDTPAKQARRLPQYQSPHTIRQSVTADRPSIRLH